MAQPPHLRRAVIVLTTLALIGTESWAAEWAAVPRVSLREEYNDNIRLTDLPHNEVWGTILEPRIALSRRTELSELDATARVRASWYSGEEGLDTNDDFFDLSARRKFERGSLAAFASLANDTTLQNETLDLDTGLVITQVDRSQRIGRITAQYLLTESTWVEASAGYTVVNYDDGERYGLLDYDYFTPGLQLVHQLNPRLQIYGLLNYSRVDYDATSELKSETKSAQVGIGYNISEVWSINASIGGRRTETSSLVLAGYTFDLRESPPWIPYFEQRDSETTGVVYNASLSRQFETGNISLSGSQSITPSSTGTDTETSTIVLSGLHRFSARTSGTIALSYFNSSTVGDVTTRADSERFRITPGMAWRLTEGMALNAGYAYTRIKQEAASDYAVESNMAFLTLGYTWPRAAISR